MILCTQYVHLPVCHVNFLVLNPLSVCLSFCVHPLQTLYSDDTIAFVVSISCALVQLVSSYVKHTHIFRIKFSIWIHEIDPFFVLSWEQKAKINWHPVPDRVKIEHKHNLFFLCLLLLLLFAFGVGNDWTRSLPLHCT